MRRAVLVIVAAASAAVSANAAARCRLDAPPPAAFVDETAINPDAAAAADWMRIAMKTAVAAELSAPAASRLYAVTAIAMHDAYALSTGLRPYAVAVSPPRAFSSADAAAAVRAAAAALLSEAYPEVAELYADALGGGDKSARAVAARRFGDDIGRRAFKQCYYLVEEYPQTEPVAAARSGEWRPTKSYYGSGLEPGWPERAPVELQNIDEFIPPGPPSLESRAYADALEEVRRIGRQPGGERTDKETEIARFWEGGMQTSAPPGHWNAIALQELGAYDLARRVEVLLVLNIAMADAGLAAWTTKYRYAFWRPETAIREAGADLSWGPIIESPMFPEYVSGHSAFSAAAATVLTHYLGAYPITVGTESMVGGVTRSFASFDAAAREAGRSRVYGGIHFEFSNVDGLRLGEAVALEVIMRIDARIR